MFSRTIIKSIPRSRLFSTSAPRNADFTHAVIGAGAVGLAVARKLQSRDGASTVLIEKHSAIGTETSSRNSEVWACCSFAPFRQEREWYLVMHRYCLRNVWLIRYRWSMRACTMGKIRWRRSCVWEGRRWCMIFVRRIRYRIWIAGNGTYGPGTKLTVCCKSHSEITYEMSCFNLTYLITFINIFAYWTIANVVP